MSFFYSLRSIVGMFLVVLATVFFSTIIIVMSVTPFEKRVSDWAAVWWGRTACAFFGIEIKIHGLENRPSGGAILLFNHTSFFDIFVMVASLKGLRFGAKIELFKVPFLGGAMRRAGTLPIARNRREEVFKVYEEAKPRFARGDQFALAPEGTRQTEERLGEFKAGPFIFGIQSGVPLVPVVIRGAHGIMPKGRWWPNSDAWKKSVDIYILAPVLTKGKTLEDRQALQQQIRGMMAKYF